MEDIFSNLFETLKQSALSCTSKDIALSGGLDSSILAYYLKDKKLQATAIITKDFLASDLTYCQLIANTLDLPLDIKTVQTNELLDAVEETIKILKIFNDIEIRNSVVMYIALKTIKEKTHLLSIHEFTLSCHRNAFALGGLCAERFQFWLPIAGPLRLVNPLFEKSVHNQIGIPADGRGKMGIGP